MASSTPTLSSRCINLYNKLNTFVTSVINRDVTPKITNLNTEVWGSNTQTGDSRIDDLESDVNSLNTSITNLVQIYYIFKQTSSTVVSGGTKAETVTVPALPNGFSAIFVMEKGANGIVFEWSLSNTTLTLTGQNLRSNTQTIYMRGYLIYVPTGWIKSL